jgi:tellurite resistance-related uncharacterized protein
VSDTSPFAQTLPEGAVCTRTTDVFTEATLPAGLKKVHNTRDGVWAVVSVVDGSASFRFLPEGASRELSAGDEVVVDPRHDHVLTPGPTMKVQIAFFRVDNA